ncbi:hypothetical protein PspLS_00106 [Pyricularia sp. CBS 133598]|nr:hypothetical protein PspLS_00106 [Pyricularia sp. CBS 133598]
MKEVWPCFQGIKDEGIKLERTLEVVREFFSSGNNHFKLLEEPAVHFLVREDCGHKFVRDIDLEELEPDLMISDFGSVCISQKRTFRTSEIW